MLRRLFLKLAIVLLPLALGCADSPTDPPTELPPKIEPEIPLQSITAADTILGVGDVIRPKITWNPPDASIQSYRVHSDDRSVAVINLNRIQAVGTGSTTITVVPTDGGESKQTTFDVSVTLDKSLNKIIANGPLPSLAAAIVKNDSLVWQGFYGYSDVAQGEAPTQETIYILASISKTITATAAMQAWERGLLDLDADINDYLPFEIHHPKFPETPITVRFLLKHQSGLAWPNGEDPNFYQTFPGDSAPDLGTWLKNYLVPGGSEYVAAMWLNSKPGATVSYSNVGAALLGFVVESVVGQDFAEFCQENIFEPLEMFNSGFKLSEVDNSKLATLYDASRAVVPHYSVKFYPATTIRSSVEDFSKFLIAILNGGEYKGKRILQAATVNTMLRIQNASGIGLIWWNQGGGYMGHNGSFFGVSSNMAVNRTTKTGVMIFTNLFNQNTVWQNGEIYNLVYREASKF